MSTAWWCGQIAAPEIVARHTPVARIATHAVPYCIVNTSVLCIETVAQSSEIIINLNSLVGRNVVFGNCRPSGGLLVDE